MVTNGYRKARIKHVLYRKKTSMDNNPSTAQRTNCNTKQVNQDGPVSKDNVQYYLNCYCTNANSFMIKRNEFEAVLDIWKPKIIGITESWCDNSILDSELSLEGYTLHRVRSQEK